MDLMTCPACGADIATGGRLCEKCGTDITQEKADRRKSDVILFIGAAAGAAIGVFKMGFLGLIMAFPGMFLAALIPNYKKPASPDTKNN